MDMTDFEYIAFDDKTGDAVAHGPNMLDVFGQVEKLQAEARARGDRIPSYATLFCGQTGPYVWAEKLNLRRATILIDTHITTQPVAVPVPATQLEEMRG